MLVRSRKMLVEERPQHFFLTERVSVKLEFP
jgi:hypothetical protein